MAYLNKIPRMNPDLAWRIIEHEVVMLAVDKPEEVNFFNETATYIWSLINNKHSVNDIIAKVYNKYALKRPQAQKEVVAFLSELKRKELIKL